MKNIDLLLIKLLRLGILYPKVALCLPISAPMAMVLLVLCPFWAIAQTLAPTDSCVWSIGTLQTGVFTPPISLTTSATGDTVTHKMLTRPFNESLYHLGVCHIRPSVQVFDTISYTIPDSLELFLAANGTVLGVRNTDSTVHLTRYDEDLEVTWSSTYNLGQDSARTIRAVTVTNGGAIWLTFGYNGPLLALMMIHPDGQLNWLKHFPLFAGTNIFGLFPVEDGVILHYGVGLLAKVDTTGQMIWSNTWLGNQGTIIRGIAPVFGTSEYIVTRQRQGPTGPSTTCDLIKIMADGTLGVSVPALQLMPDEHTFFINSIGTVEAIGADEYMVSFGRLTTQGIYESVWTLLATELTLKCAYSLPQTTTKAAALTRFFPPLAQIISVGMDNAQITVLPLPCSPRDCISENMSNASELASSDPVIQCSPNPFSTQVYVSVPPQIDFAYLLIINNLGQIMETVDINGNIDPALLETSQWPVGRYNLHLLDRNGHWLGAKAIIKVLE
jgi:hypothetical protein